METSLAQAGNLLWEVGCGALPVVDEVGKVVGLLSDREVGLALAMLARPASEIPVRVVFHPSATCRASDDVRDALRIMRTRKVRQLPVVDGAGLLQGMLSFSDVVLAAKPDRLASPGDVADEDLILALKSITARTRVQQSETPVAESRALV